MPTLYRNAIALLAATVLVACSDSKDQPADAPEPAKYSASVTRTSFGLPHIKAKDWGGLGYGYGYAYAQDNFCITMKEIVIASGRSAELMGEAEGNI